MSNATMRHVTLDLPRRVYSTCGPQRAGWGYAGSYAF
uniref:Uncharacterized protein n=1 Tax=Anguilla anguilla TaxID=7936 RepID=A0A0E9R4G2_ANGAN